MQALSFCLEKGRKDRMNYSDIWLFIISLIVLLSLTMMRKAIKTIGDALSKHETYVDNRLRHLLHLMSMVSSLMPPGLRRYYSYVISHPEMTIEEVEKMRMTLMAEDFTALRNHLTTCMENVPDPALKEALDKAISDMDDVWNLMNSIDENSSSEQKELVQSELMKIISKGRGFGGLQM
jgi:hypothetical protein